MEPRCSQVGIGSTWIRLGFDLDSTWIRLGFDLVNPVNPIVNPMDAMSPAGCSGHIRRLSAVAQSLPGDLFAGSIHMFGEAQGVEMSCALGIQPPKRILYGIEGRNFAIGTPVSAEIRDAISQVTAAVLEALYQSCRCLTASL
jgi:hypothetical protein